MAEYDTVSKDLIQTYPKDFIRLTLEIEGQEIIDGGPSGLFPFVPLMKRPSGIDSEAWLRHCVDAANALRVDESIKIDFLGRLMILSGLEYDPILINYVYHQKTVYSL